MNRIISVSLVVSFCCTLVFSQVQIRTSDSLWFSLNNTSGEPKLSTIQLSPGDSAELYLWLTVTSGVGYDVGALYIPLFFSANNETDLRIGSIGAGRWQGNTNSVPGSIDFSFLVQTPFDAWNYRALYDSNYSSISDSSGILLALAQSSSPGGGWSGRSVLARFVLHAVTSNTAISPFSQPLNNGSRNPLVLTNTTGTQKWRPVFIDLNVVESAFTSSLTLPGLRQSSVTAGDISGDSLPELIIQGYDPLSAEGFVTRFMENNGGILSDIPTTLTGMAGGANMLIDWNNDGRPDVGMTGDSGTFVTQLFQHNELSSSSLNNVALVHSEKRGREEWKSHNYTDFEFTLVGTPFPPTGASSISHGDFDLDGREDVILVGDSLGVVAITRIYLNKKTGWEVFYPGMGGITFGSIEVFDMDNDGDLDIAGSRHGIWRNDAMTFVQVDNLLDFAKGDIEAADYDGDGDMDIALAGEAGGVFYTKIFKNDGGSFDTINANMMGISEGEVLWFDANNDGFLDLLVCGKTAAEPVCKIYKNQGGDVFTDMGAGLTGVSESSHGDGSVTVLDFNGDGKLDIFISGSSTIPLLDGEDSPSKSLISDVAILYKNNSLTTNRSPSVPTYLSSYSSGDTLRCLWENSIDDKTPSDGLTYDLRVGTAPDLVDIKSILDVPRLGNVYQNTSWTVNGLGDGRYYWSVRAVDNSFAHSLFSPNQLAYVGIIQTSTTYQPGWNIVSVPVKVPQALIDSLFPGSISAAYRYDCGLGYVTDDTLEVGTAYWLKFSTQTDINFVGSGIAVDTLEMCSGWNMVGGITDSIPVSSVVPINTTLLTPFWSFDSGKYSIVSTLRPGRGYWVKTSTIGQLVLSVNSIAEFNIPEGRGTLQPLNAISFVDQSGQQQSVYFGVGHEDTENSYSELPPVPPHGVFDIRFKSQKRVEIISDVQNENGVAYPIAITSVIYPIDITWKITDGLEDNYVLTDGHQIIPLRGKGLARLMEPSNGTLFLRRKITGAVPLVVDLKQSYPNPFNPVTTIGFSLSEYSRVKLDVTDLLGRIVRTLIDNGEYNAGYHQIDFDASEFSSGVYLYRLSTDGFTGKNHLVRRMIFIR